MMSPKSHSFFSISPHTQYFNEILKYIFHMTDIAKKTSGASTDLSEIPILACHVRRCDLAQD